MDGPVCVDCMSPEKWCSCQPTGAEAVSQIGFYDVPSIQASLQIATLEGERDQLRHENEKLRDALFRHACYCGCGDPNPELHRVDCVYRRACLGESFGQQKLDGP